jgi:hypothetical protein
MLEISKPSSVERFRPDRSQTDLPRDLTREVHETHSNSSGYHVVEKQLNRLVPSDNEEDHLTPNSKRMPPTTVGVNGG